MLMVTSQSSVDKISFSAGWPAAPSSFSLMATIPAGPRETETAPLLMVVRRLALLEPAAAAAVIAASIACSTIVTDVRARRPDVAVLSALSPYALGSCQKTDSRRRGGTGKFVPINS